MAKANTKQIALKDFKQRIVDNRDNPWVLQYLRQVDFLPNLEKIGDWDDFPQLPQLVLQLVRATALTQDEADSILDNAPLDKVDPYHPEPVQPQQETEEQKKSDNNLDAIQQDVVEGLEKIRTEIPEDEKDEHEEILRGVAKARVRNNGQPQAHPMMLNINPDRPILRSRHEMALDGTEVIPNSRYLDDNNNPREDIYEKDKQNDAAKLRATERAKTSESSVMATAQTLEATLRWAIEVEERDTSGAQIPAGDLDELAERAARIVAPQVNAIVEGLSAKREDATDGDITTSANQLLNEQLTSGSINKQMEDLAIQFVDEKIRPETPGERKELVNKYKRHVLRGLHDPANAHAKGLETDIGFDPQNRMRIDTKIKEREPEGEPASIDISTHIVDQDLQSAINNPIASSRLARVIVTEDGTTPISVETEESTIPFLVSDSGFYSSSTTPATSSAGIDTAGTTPSFISTPTTVTPPPYTSTITPVPTTPVSIPLTTTPPTIAPSTPSGGTPVPSTTGGAPAPRPLPARISPLDRIRVAAGEGISDEMRYVTNNPIGWYLTSYSGFLGNTLLPDFLTHYAPGHFLNRIIGPRLLLSLQNRRVKETIEKIREVGSGAYLQSKILPFTNSDLVAQGMMFESLGELTGLVNITPTGKIRLNALTVLDHGLKDTLRYAHRNVPGHDRLLTRWTTPRRFGGLGMSRDRAISTLNGNFRLNWATRRKRAVQRYLEGDLNMFGFLFRYGLTSLISAGLTYALEAGGALRRFRGVRELYRHAQSAWNYGGGIATDEYRRLALREWNTGSRLRGAVMLNAGSTGRYLIRPIRTAMVVGGQVLGGALRGGVVYALSTTILGTNPVVAGLVGGLYGGYKAVDGIMKSRYIAHKYLVSGGRRPGDILNLKNSMTRRTYLTGNRTFFGRLVRAWNGHIVAPNALAPTGISNRLRRFGFFARNMPADGMMWTFTLVQLGVPLHFALIPVGLDLGSKVFRAGLNMLQLPGDQLPSAFGLTRFRVNTFRHFMHTVIMSPLRLPGAIIDMGTGLYTLGKSGGILGVLAGWREGFSWNNVFRSLGALSVPMSLATLSMMAVGVPVWSFVGLGTLAIYGVDQFLHIIGQGGLWNALGLHKVVDWIGGKLWDQFGGSIIAAGSIITGAVGFLKALIKGDIMGMAISAAMMGIGSTVFIGVTGVASIFPAASYTPTQEALVQPPVEHVFGRSEKEILGTVDQGAPGNTSGTAGVQYSITYTLNVSTLLTLAEEQGIPVGGQIQIHEGDYFSNIPYTIFVYTIDSQSTINETGESIEFDTSGYTIGPTNAMIREIYFRNDNFSSIKTLTFTQTFTVYFKDGLGNSISVPELLASAGDSFCNKYRISYAYPDVVGDDGDPLSLETPDTCISQ